MICNCEKAKPLIQEWLDKQGHDRCWYYPEIFTSLTKLFDIAPGANPDLPPKSEFEEGCRRYQREEYNER